MRNNEELITEAFERSKTVIERQRMRRRTAAATVLGAAVLMTGAVFVYTRPEPLPKDVEIMTSAPKENDDTQTEKGVSSKQNESNVSSKQIESKVSSKQIESKVSSKQDESKASSKQAESKASSKQDESKASSTQDESRSSSTQIEGKSSSKQAEITHEQAPVENNKSDTPQTTESSDPEKSKSRVESPVYSRAEAHSDIDPSVDRSRIPSVGKIAVDTDAVTVSGGRGNASQPYIPPETDDSDTEQWYPPDVFAHTGFYEKTWNTAEELVNDSQAVVTGTVEGISFDSCDGCAARTPEGWQIGVMWTVYKVRVEEYLKGGDGSEYIYVYSEGGFEDKLIDEQLAAIQGDRLIPIIDRQNAEEGKKYIFVLTHNDKYTPVNMSQSIYEADNAEFTSLCGDVTTADILNVFNNAISNTNLK